VVTVIVDSLDRRARWLLLLALAPGKWSLIVAY
jgi:hypothetical protein